MGSARAGYWSVPLPANPALGSAREEQCLQLDGQLTGDQLSISATWSARVIGSNGFGIAPSIA